MAYYFIGGEDHDFQRIGAVSVSTSVQRRAAYTRCSLQVSGTAAAPQDGWVGALNASVSSCWFTARIYPNSGTGAPTVYWLMFRDGGTPRLGLTMDSTAHIRIVKVDNAGTMTTLATSVLTVASSILYKFDLQISNYGASGTVNVYVDGLLWVTYTGDITTNSATSLSGFQLGCNAASNNCFWSEIICGSGDTRSEGLITLPPAANGAAWTGWTGSYANVDEVTLDELDLTSSAAAGDIAQATVTSSGLTGNPSIHAVAVTARAQKGNTGPANLDFGVRTGATNYWGSDIALPAAYGAIQTVWETNPNTAAAWVPADLTAAGFNIGVRSVA